MYTNTEQNISGDLWSGGIVLTMGKRFPLLMENQIEVNNLEELQDNFSLQKIREYFENGQLVQWL